MRRGAGRAVLLLVLLLVAAAGCGQSGSSASDGGPHRLVVRFAYTGAAAEGCAITGPPEAAVGTGDEPSVDLGSDGGWDMLEADGTLFVRGAVVPGLDVEWIALPTGDQRAELVAFASLTVLGRRAPWLFDLIADPAALVSRAEELHDSGADQPAALDDPALGDGSMTWSIEGDDVRRVTLTPSAADDDPLAATSLDVAVAPGDRSDPPAPPTSAVAFVDAPVAPFLVSAELVDPACNPGRADVTDCLARLAAGRSVGDWLAEAAPGRQFGEGRC